MGSPFVTEAGHTGAVICVQIKRENAKEIYFRHDGEYFGDFVNFFTLWPQSPLAAWPGLRMSTKLDFPFKVELSGSWGEQVRFFLGGNL